MTTTTAAQPMPQSKLAQIARSLLSSREGVLLVILILTMLGISTQTDNFLTKDNLLNQLRLMTEVGLVALPMTYIIITGGIDLSVGSIFGLTAILLGYSWLNWDFDLPTAIAFGIAIGTLAGFVNGLMIVGVGVPPLIMTLATLTLYRGLAEGIAKGRSARGYPEWFYEMGQGEFLGVPTQLWVLLVAVIIAAIVLEYTVFGRSLYAIGHNAVGARFSGIPVGRNLLIIYTFSGFMAGLAGYIFVSRVSTTRSDMGMGIELDAIAAVILGGTSIFGGTGSITGTVIGVVLIQFLKNGLSLTGVTGDATIIIVGSVLILSTLVNNFIQKYRAV